MSISIRAGLLYNLAADTLDRIHSTTVTDILYSVGKLNLVKELSFYLYMMKEFAPADCGSTYSVESIMMLFEYHYEYILELFASKGYTIENVEWMSNLVLFIRDQIEPGKVVIDRWVDSKDKPGIRFEKIALDMLRGIGFDIGTIESRKLDIDAGITVELHGRPDGVIHESPGNCFESGTLIEVKHKRMIGCQQRDLMQMAAYSKIYDRDVLYLCITGEDKLSCQLYKKHTLQKIFNKRLDIVLQNCITLHKLISNVSDETSMLELIRLCL